MPADEAPTRYAPPPGAWDCHIHIFGPADRFPLADSRAYDPGLADVGQAEAMLDRLGVARAVLVQPSVYGVDNGCMLDALDRFDGRARGVAVIDPVATPASLLDDFQRRRVRALRLNWVEGDRRLTAPELAERLAALLPVAGPRGWHLLIHAPAALLAGLGPAIEDAPVPIVLDHMAGIRTSGVEAEADADLVLDLFGCANVWVKIAAPYRLAADAAAAARLAGFVRRLAVRGPDRLIWGSDWPHTGPHQPGRRGHGFRPIDTGGLLADLDRVIGDATLVRRILCRNPLTLYGT